MVVAVVGVCASGKTTLVKKLQALGIEAYNVAQEHSGIKKLWQRKTPDVLVMLDANLQTIQKRRAVAWGEDRLVIQRERLLDAKQHADLFIQTDTLSQEDVVQAVLNFIQEESSSWQRSR